MGGSGIHLKGSQGEVLVRLGIDHVTTSIQAHFSKDGKYFTWGSSDSTVFLADVAEVQKRLAEFHLGW